MPPLKHFSAPFRGSSLLWSLRSLLREGPSSCFGYNHFASHPTPPPIFSEALREGLHWKSLRLYHRSSDTNTNTLSLSLSLSLSHTHFLVTSFLLSLYSLTSNSTSSLFTFLFYRSLFTMSVSLRNTQRPRERVRDREMKWHRGHTHARIFTHFFLSLPIHFHSYASLSQGCCFLAEIPLYLFHFLSHTHSLFYFLIFSLSILLPLPLSSSLLLSHHLCNSLIMSLLLTVSFYLTPFLSLSYSLFPLSHSLSLFYSLILSFPYSLSLSFSLFTYLHLSLLLSLFLTHSITLSFPHSLCYSLFPLLTIFFILNISSSLSIPLLPTHFLFIWVSAFVLVLLALTIFSHVLWRIFYAAIKILGHRYPFNLPPIDSLDVNLNFDFCCLNFCSREPLSKRDVGFEPRYIRNQLLRWHIVLFLKCFPIHSTFCMI